MTDKQPEEPGKKPEPVVAEAGKPLTPERIAEIKAPRDPRLSPDGTRVAFVLREISKPEEHEQSAIWIMPFTGDTLTDARQFTTGLWRDGSPRWSPDGTRLAFLSDRAERGKMSVYVMPCDGGEALRVFDEQGGVNSLAWSPDGRYLGVLFTPGETEAEKKRKEERDDAKVWDEDDKYQRLWVIDLDVGSATSITPENLQARRFAWSPDSRRIAYTTTHNPRVNDELGENEVWIVAREGGEPVQAFSLIGEPVGLLWSGDGKSFAFLARGDKVVHPEVIYTIPVTGGEPTNITPDYWGTFEYLAPFGDGSELLAFGTEGVNQMPYRVSWDGELHPLLASGQPGFSDGGTAIDIVGDRLVTAWQGPDEPPNIYVAERLAGGGDGRLRRRTDFNPDLLTAALGETEIVRWTSDPDVEVEGILVKPHGYIEGMRYPLIVHIHGGPTWAWPNTFYANSHDWAQMLAGRGYAILMPNPRGSTGRGVGYNNQIFDDIGGGEYRDMMAGVDAMIECGIADPERLGIGGWSWGGYMTAWAISQTTRFKAAVMGAGLPNMVTDNSIGDIPSANDSYFSKSPYEDPEPLWERSAIRYINRVTTPTLVLHGADDERVNTTQGLEMYTALRQRGVRTRFVTYPREGHGIRERKHQIDLMKRIIAWYDEHLRGKRD
ncbi:MAG: S9 family peptidase [Thermomicrobiales bacterium]